MRRVVVTGMGIVSSIGNNINEVINSLTNLNSGIQINLFMRKWALGVMFRDQLKN